MEREERWLPVEDFPGYRVSDLGRVYSLDRYIRYSNGTVQHQQGRMLKLGRNSDGYPRVSLCRDGGRMSVEVHTLVLTAFAGPPQPGQECLHGPNGPTDNRWPEAIKWGTRSQNNGADKVRDGTSNRGTAHLGAKLTEQIVAECRQRNAQGETSYALAREHGVTGSVMWKAVTGRTWRHVC